MVAAPIFGYLGDRFNRKIILSCGIFFWSAVTLSSSFITKEYYWLFVLSRGLVGIGESSYSSISPTIIGDLFTNNSRTMMLSVFYLAIPLGSGLGYILGSSAKEAAGDWHWALRVSPVLGMTAGTLILRSYVFSSLASAAVSFATGAFGMWIPLYLFRAQVVQKTAEACTKDICSSKDSLIFGAITCVTGLLGVVIGAATTRLCRQKTERADPLVCAVSMLGSAIFVCLIFVVAKKSIIGAYVCIFIGETLLFLNWAITADILMYVVIPTRRATAVAFQGFTSHLLGDAGSPYLIGLISDALQKSYTRSVLWQFLSLGYALMLCPFVIVLGGILAAVTRPPSSVKVYCVYYGMSSRSRQGIIGLGTLPPSSLYHTHTHAPPSFLPLSHSDTHTAQRNYQPPPPQKKINTHTGETFCIAPANSPQQDNGEGGPEGTESGITTDHTFRSSSSSTPTPDPSPSVAYPP
ncbi:unnamed protein product, partial [Coregonus sp. 'balchen']